jgi:glycine C-acetyltransferase
MGQPLQWIDDEIANLKSSGLYNRIRTLSSAQGAYLTVDGRQVLNFCSNNYLGWHNHLAWSRRHAKPSCATALDRPPCVPLPEPPIYIWTSSGGSRRSKAQATITFQSGFSQPGAIAALAGGEDAIFPTSSTTPASRRCRLSGAKIIRFAHPGAGPAARSGEQRAAFRRALVITDGVFSMDGDVAPLAETPLRHTSTERC